MPKQAVDSRYVLLVIDMLEDFFEPPSALADSRARLVARTNELVRAFRRRRHPVVWVRQEFRADLRDAFLAMRRQQRRVTIAGTKGAEILAELERAESDPVVVKKRYSAFFGTPLESMLESWRPETIVVTGVNTHACVRTTVIDAYQRDYDVVVAADAVASYDREHHDVTTRYLSGGIARFLGNAAILEMLDQGVPAVEASGPRR